MANKFIIRKKLVVSGSDTQPLVVQGPSGQLLTVASSSQGNIFIANSTSGITLLKVSASEFTMGKNAFSKGWAVESTLDSVAITGSALLTSVTVPGNLPQGDHVLATGSYSYAQGNRTTASGDYSHAQGSGSKALAYYSHAQGNRTTATGIGSHAEGASTIAYGSGSHAEGANTHAYGSGSHAEGRSTWAGAFSHTQGYNTTASGEYQHVIGQFNSTSSNSGEFIHGNGTSNTARRNLIYAYGTGSTGVVLISGSVLLSAGSTGKVSQPIEVLRVTAYTLTDLDNGTHFLFRDPTPGTSTSYCIVNFPSDLSPNFSTTLTTVDQTLLMVTGSGVQFVNNKGNGLGMELSVTLINTQTPNEYLSLGDL